MKQGPSDPIPDGIPESLKEAVRNFVLVVATREARGQGKKHDSMLVHVSYRVAWIDGISMLVDDYFQLIRQHVRVGDRVMLADLKNQYESEFLSKTDAIKASLNYDDAGIVSTPWSNVLLALQSAVDKIEVRAVHATRRGVQMPPSDLLYEDHLDSGLHVIAVGGGKLSRGLTLEGLSIRYFLRTTRYRISNVLNPHPLLYHLYRNHLQLIRACPATRNLRVFFLKPSSRRAKRNF